MQTVSSFHFGVYLPDLFALKYDKWLHVHACPFTTWNSAEPPEMFSAQIGFHICAAHAVPSGAVAGPLSVLHRYTRLRLFMRCLADSCRACACARAQPGPARLPSVHVRVLTLTVPLSSKIRARVIRAEYPPELAQHACSVPPWHRSLFSQFHQGLDA